MFWITILFLCLFFVALVINAYGLYRFHDRNKALSAAIMWTSFLAIALRVGLITWELIKPSICQDLFFYFVYFELPFHVFNLVAYLILLHWVQAYYMLRQKRIGHVSCLGRSFLSNRNFTIFIICSELVFWIILGFHCIEYFENSAVS